MSSKCPKCDKTVYFAEKVSSLGKDWHKLCLKCDRCNKLLNAGGHAEHDGRPYCHKPCYAALFGPKGVNIGGAGSYVYDAPANNNASPTSVDSVPKAEEKRVFAPKAAPKGKRAASGFAAALMSNGEPLVDAAGGITTFSGEANLCPRCNKKVYFAEKVTSLGKDWHRPCLRCERCSKTLTPGSHAEHDSQPYCHKPCYAVLFGPKGVNTGGVGSYIYEKEPSAVTQP
uniref:Cysteine-rich protein 2 n=1 Tax=Gasterosteus aculeatus aculeatus TaxID=481459 RepID=G3PBA6_GASAC